MILFPVSDNALAIAFLAAIVIGVLYSLWYWMAKSERDGEISQLKTGFSNHQASAESALGFPSGSSKDFPIKHFDDRFGFATQRTEGAQGWAMCVHSNLDSWRLYFFVDFASMERIEAIIHLLSDNPDDPKVALKITPESSMFSHERVRYFEIPSGSAGNALERYRSIRINSIDYDFAATRYLTSGSVT